MLDCWILRSTFRIFLRKLGGGTIWSAHLDDALIGEFGAGLERIDEGAEIGEFLFGRAQSDALGYCVDLRLHEIYYYFAVNRKNYFQAYR